MRVRVRVRVRVCVCGHAPHRAPRRTLPLGSPYARVVAMHKKYALPVKDPVLMGTGRTTAYEYDGLEPGELAWIAGRQSQFTTAALVPTFDEGIQVQTLGGNSDNRFDKHVPPSDTTSMVSGYGPDRHQRLAYTKWIEALFDIHVGKQAIDLTSITLGADDQLNVDPGLKRYEHLVSKAGLFAVPDLAYALDAAKAGATDGNVQPVSVAMMQGIFVMEQGAFLRTYGAEHMRASIHVFSEIDGTRLGTEDVDRHLGSEIAQRALMAELKLRGLFNWTPDGITLSKLETGPDGIEDAYFDAKMGQLYNIGVQGPCITKTWCGDPAQQAMPMDKVFVVVVATLEYELGDVASGGRELTLAARNATKDLKDNVLLYGKPGFVKMDEKSKEIRNTLGVRDAVTLKATYGGKGSVRTAYDQYVAAETEYQSASADPKTSKADVELKLTAAKDAWKKFSDKWSTEQRKNVATESFKERALGVRNGNRFVEKASLFGFRLMRVSSSYLSNCSHFDPTVATSRCGLKIAYDETNEGSGMAEYIIGGWCIGTVLDSAASRAMGHSGIRTAPASMAINVNVNVEWWDGDKLFKHYQDKDRGIYGSGGGGQKFQGTTLPRTIAGWRTVGDVMNERELSKEDAAKYLKEGASNPNSVGTFNHEGGYRQPDPYGVNTDPKSDNKGELGRAKLSEPDERVWTLT